MFFTVVQLDEACDNTKKCEPGFSSCTAGVCKCLPNFVPINGDECSGPIGGVGWKSGSSAPKFGSRCLKDSLAQVLKFTGTNRFKRGTPPVDPYEWNGGCPAGQYCYVSDGYVAKGCHAYAI